MLSNLALIQLNRFIWLFGKRDLDTWICFIKCIIILILFFKVIVKIQFLSMNLKEKCQNSMYKYYKLNQLKISY